jgi:hypothetical protein
LKLIAFLVLTGCAGVDVERSYRECLLLDRDATYTVSKDMSRVECRR